MTRPDPTSAGQRALGAATGVLFGALLQRGGLARSDTIVAQLEGRDARVLTTMGTAVAVGAIGLEWMRRTQGLRPEVKPMKTGGVVAGALLFGTGMALGGYCPGTAVAGAGAGRHDAMWAALGMAAGAAAFVAAYPSIKPLLDAGNLGRRRLAG